jgi:glyoxylase-like metal-dependent hydrolase (beta-lactamase superfamily II)
MRVDMSAQAKEIAAGVYWIATGRLNTNVYFVRSGPAWVLIDAGWPNQGQLIKETAELLFGPNTRPATILITHLHPDHAGSARELAALWSRPVLVHPAELPLAAETYPPEYYGPIDRWVVAPLLRILPRQLRGLNVHDVVCSFDPAAVPGLENWACIHTPGHTPGHVAFFRSSDRVLIAGDAILTLNINSLWDFLRNTQRVSGPPYVSTWNWPMAKASVAALARLDPNVLACGHGVPMTGPETAQALHRFADHFAAGIAIRNARRA